MASKTPKVGQSIIVKISGVPQKAVVSAVINTTKGIKLIVAFGHEQVATVDIRDVLGGFVGSRSAGRRGILILRADSLLH